MLKDGIHTVTVKKKMLLAKMMYSPAMLPFSELILELNIDGDRQTK